MQNFCIFCIFCLGFAVFEYLVIGAVRTLFNFTRSTFFIISTFLVLKLQVLTDCCPPLDTNLFFPEKFSSGMDYHSFGTFTTYMHFTLHILTITIKHQSRPLIKFYFHQMSYEYYFTVRRIFGESEKVLKIFQKHPNSNNLNTATQIRL